MGGTTSIKWTDSTVNAWHGCTKVSPGCKHCYAEVSTPVRVKRAAGLEVWGPQAARSETKSWERDLRKWNRAQADTMARWEAAGPAGSAPPKPHRVFAQSLADTFEDYQGGKVVEVDMVVPTLASLRDDFLAVVEECKALTFQLLTKRPENIMQMVPRTWRERWPEHVWIGCTVEDQERADERIPHLLRVPAAVRFLSVEPQLEEVIVDPKFGMPWLGPKAISWVIQGGESGPRARPFDLAWARSLRDQCRAAGVAYFLKQLGANAHVPQSQGSRPLNDTRWSTVDSHGGDESEWPADLRDCRAFPNDPR